METTKEKPVETKRPSYKSLLVENIKYRTQLTKKYINRTSYEPVNEKMIRVFIPGTIMKIFVKKGKKVKEGDKLLIFEAMKMNNDILSPVDGVIESVNVKVGDKVTKQQIIIEIK
jgi:biotin carboxyl carrier protein